MTGDEEAVLAANRGFYRALAARDLAAMDRVWSTNAAVCCLHPGSLPLTDRRSVMKSWAGILKGSGGLSVMCRDERVAFFGACAVVVCLEVIESAVLAATNVFILEAGQEWRMVLHQAGPTAAARPPAASVPRGFLH